MSRIEGQQFHGVCKFWDAIKGHGFLTADDGGDDLFVSQHDLVTGDAGYRALTAGQRCECIYSIGDKGKAVAKTVTGPNGATLKSFKDMYTAKRAIESKKPADPNKMYGSIKWFNAEKSFGFIIPQAGGPDLFFHFTECLKEIVPAEGDQVEYKTKQDKAGKTVGAEVKNKTQKAAKKAAIAEHQSAPVAAYAAGYAAPPAAYGYAPAAYGKKSGTVKFFDEAKGYGFIVPDAGGRDIHVHKSSVMGGELEKDDHVEYEEELLNGKMQAVTVSRTGVKRGAGSTAGRPAVKKAKN